MNPKNEDFPSALEAIFLVIGLFAVEYIVSAALSDLRPLSGVDPEDIAGVVVLLGNGVFFSALLYYQRMTYASLFHSSGNSVAATVGTLTVPILLIVPGSTLVVWTVQALLVSAFPLSHWHQAMFE